MPVINLLTQSSPSKSTDEISSAMINMYLTGESANGKYTNNAFPTPGLSVFSTLASPVRALYTEHGVIYAVGGNKFYSIASSGIATTLGTLNTSSGFAKIAGINEELLIIDGSNGYCYKIDSNIFSTLSSTTYVSTVNMTAAGKNYTVPTAQIFDSIGTGSTASVLIENGQLVSIAVTNGGTGYSNPVITFAGGGLGATAYATVNTGVIGSITISAPGYGYTSPTVIITDSTGSGATATATATTIASTTPLTNLTLLSAGTGYTNPVVEILDVTGTGGTATATLSGSTISSITLTSPGTGYTNPVVAIYDSTATGSGATATANLVAGQISSTIVNANGSGYTNPIIAFYDTTGTQASARITTTSSSFDNTVSDCTCQDEFGLAIKPQSQTWYSSAISDVTTWPALSVAQTTGNQNNIIGIASIHREIWLFCDQTTEVWYNAGNVYFTWQRRPDVFIEWGCCSRDSIAKGNSTVFFLAQSPTGGIVVLTMSGYNPIVISTPPMNYAFSTYSTVSDAKGFCYQQEGHEFYVLTFPTAGVTWVYDMSTQEWHQRESSNTRWLANCFAYCYNKALIGDYNSGNVYLLDMTAYTENSTAITRVIQTQPYYQAGVQIYCDRLQIDFDQTPGSQLNQINLYVSRDGGNTFGTAKPAFPVQTSDGQWRVYWPRLGRARTWVFRIETTMSNKFIVLGAWANFRLADN